MKAEGPGVKAGGLAGDGPAIDGQKITHPPEGALLERAIREMGNKLATTYFCATYRSTIIGQQSFNRRVRDGNECE